MASRRYSDVKERVAATGPPQPILRTGRQGLHRYGKLEGDAKPDIPPDCLLILYHIPGSLSSNIFGFQAPGRMLLSGNTLRSGNMGPFLA
jgi:hypothetical protein